MRFRLYCSRHKSSPARRPPLQVQTNRKIRSISNKANGTEKGRLSGRLHHRQKARRHHQKLLAIPCRNAPYRTLGIRHQRKPMERHPETGAKAESGSRRRYGRHLIFCGTNDYNAGIPLGEWYTYTYEETT